MKVGEMKVNERRDGNAAAEILERPKSFEVKAAGGKFLSLDAGKKELT
jgi:hypothetical protein